MAKRNGSRSLRESVQRAIQKMLSEKKENWAREPYAISTLLGVPFHQVTMEQTLGICERLLEDRSEPSYLVTANVDFTYLASRNPALRDFIFHADLVICDGLPLVGLSKLCGGCELPERVAGSDLGWPLLELCARRGFSVYFLGSDAKTLAELELVLTERLPELKIAGHCSPPIGRVESWDDAELSEKIESTDPHLLLAAFGCPKQEQWIARNHRSLGVPLSIGVGATLDFIVGKQQRAPKLAQKLCLEWFWRMCSNPRRLVKRYARDLGFFSRAAQRQWRDSRKAGRKVSGIAAGEAARLGFSVARALGGRWPSRLPRAAGFARSLVGRRFQSAAIRRGRARAALRDGAASPSQRAPVRDHRPDRDCLAKHSPPESSGAVAVLRHSGGAARSSGRRRSTPGTSL